MHRLLVALVLVIATARPARADNSGFQGYGSGGGDVAEHVLLGVLLFGADVAFTVHDIKVEDGSTPASVGEVVVTAPQVGFLGYTAVTSKSWRVPALIGLVWTGALLIHGVLELSAGDEDGDGQARVTSLGWSGSF